VVCGGRIMVCRGRKNQENDELPDSYSSPNYTLIISGVPRNFVPGGGGLQQIQLRTDRTGIWGR
jgi:hypothetical protein